MSRLEDSTNRSGQCTYFSCSRRCCPTADSLCQGCWGVSPCVLDPTCFKATGLVAPTHLMRGRPSLAEKTGRVRLLLRSGGLLACHQPPVRRVACSMSTVCSIGAVCLLVEVHGRVLLIGLPTGASSALWCHPIRYHPTSRLLQHIDHSLHALPVLTQAPLLAEAWPVNHVRVRRRFTASTLLPASWDALAVHYIEFASLVAYHLPTRPSGLTIVAPFPPSRHVNIISRLPIVGLWAAGEVAALCQMQAYVLLQ